MKFEYVEYLRITDSNFNVVELTIPETRALYEKLHRNNLGDIPEVAPEDVEKIEDYLERSEDDIIKEIEVAFDTPKEEHKMYTTVMLDGDLYSQVIKERLKVGLSVSDFINNFLREKLLSSYQLKIDWRGEKYQIPESITDAELEKFERFLEREGTLELYDELERDGNYVGDDRINKMCLRIMWGYHEEFWEEMDTKWQVELKGE